MWVVVMFDLPVDTKEAKRRYRQFHDFLEADGFMRIQYSVYARSCPSSENADVHEERVRRRVPDDGHVRIFRFTDKQFERHKVFFGKARGATEEPPGQISFF